MNTITKTNPFIILSACKGINEQDDFINTDKLNLELKTLSFPFKQVKGVYKGNKEDSFYIELPIDRVPELLNVFRNVAKKYNQETILFVDSDREARLVFVETGSSERLGHFKQVPELVAKDSTCYTFDIVNKAYYITEKE